MAKGSASAEAKLVASLQAGKAKVQSLIKGDAADPKMATSEEARKGLYDGVLRMYEALTGGLAGTLNEAYNETAQKAAVQAAKQIGEDALEVKFSKARLDNVLQIIHSGSVTDFCAVLTHKMGEQVVTALRAAVMEVLRRQAVEGLSAAEANKELQAAWARVANDANTYKFVDRGGRVWENARYFQMLVRTNSWRIWREIYLDTIASMGEDLVRISSDSGPEQCKVCKAWEGRILSVSGKDKRFPSYQDARAAGVFHPNCTHRLQAVLEGLTDDDLEEQAAENQARVDAGGSIGPTPPKPPKPGDYVPKKTHKKPKPAGPMPAKVEEEAAKKKAEDEQKAKKDAQAAKERVQALKDKGAALGAVEAALKASKANAIASLGAAKVAISESNNLFWGVDCEIPKSAYDAASNKAATPKDAQDAVKAAEAALDPVEKAGKEMVHAVAAAKAEDPATLEAAEKALAGYETALAEAKPKVEQAEKDAKAAEDACVKATEAIRAILEPLDKQAKAEKAAIDPKVKKLVVDIDAYRTGTETGLRDGSMTSGNVKDGFDNYTAKLADLKDEIAKATAVSKAISDGWAQKVAAMETDLGKIDTERKAYNNAGSKVSKAYNAVKKDVADAEAAWNAGDGKTALAKLLAAAKKEGTLDTNFNDAAFQQYQGLVASYTSKVQAVKAELARVQALVQGAAAVAPPPPAVLKAGTVKPTALPDVSMPTSRAGLTVGKSLGGHSGADARLATDANGKTFVVKESGGVSKECLKNEAAMDAFYRAAGVNVPAVTTFEEGGKQIKVSEFVTGGTEIGTWWKHATAQQRADMKKRLEDGFAADVLLANWDVAGTSGDNILVDANGVPWRIDNGGAGAFRATGKPKTADEWTNGAAKGWLHELFSMPESSLNKTYFGGIKPADVCRRIAETDWTEALQKLDPATRAVVAGRIAKCQELAALEVLESDGLTEQGMPLFIEGCRTYGAGVYKKSRVDAATWFSAKRHTHPEAECSRKFGPDELQRWKHANYAEAKSAEWYTTNAGYTTINTACRAGRQNADADRLQAYISREPDREDMWLQRGITGGLRDFVKMFRGTVTEKDFLANPQSFVGREVFDDAFMSSSPVRGGGFSGRVLLNIYAPRGAKAAYAGAFSQYKHEMEMILQRKGRYVVTKIDVDKANRRTFVDIALVSQQNTK